MQGNYRRIGICVTFAVCACTDRRSHPSSVAAMGLAGLASSKQKLLNSWIVPTLCQVQTCYLNIFSHCMQIRVEQHEKH